MLVWSLSQEDPLKEGLATDSSSLAQRIPMNRRAWQATVQGVSKSWTWLKQLSMHVSNSILLSNVPLKILRPFKKIWNWSTQNCVAKENIGNYSWIQNQSDILIILWIFVCIETKILLLISPGIYGVISAGTYQLPETLTYMELEKGECPLWVFSR